ncbi:hypothetical protein BD324DRAFT_640711 [Kockovaella imperatae]|uniref:F-box domain-containing protein n=1 Tax=Kockovaella imperatae TaxID=4999 RepID=A0A1Y1USL5_9TREE|nr:hypothetical protein BD324DRAFT_640711 [Kockovaella imperatae]ORX41010.1 hypothetical protein BD324DRAFT_640711 [Kockovaella imperatae]
MSTYSPLDRSDAVNTATYDYHGMPSAVSGHMNDPRSAGPSTGGAAGLFWQNGAPILRFEDAVVETVVTHTTRTTTSFAPVPLPRIPHTQKISLPKHLPAEEYPLANEPAPIDMRAFAINLGDSRVMVQEDGSFSPESEADNVMQGPGWKRTIFSGAEPVGGAERLNMAQAVARVSSKDPRKRSHHSHIMAATPNPIRPSENPSPPSTTEGVHTVSHRSSPPRKKIRGLPELHIANDNRGALLSPLPSPDRDDASPSSAPTTQPTPQIGSGMELAALFSLPSLVGHFENLPDKLQQQVLMHLLRRSRMPTIQRLYNFAGTALKRDFISFLPHEVAVQILKKVDTTTLAAATRVSKKWKHLIDSERCIWQQRLIDDDLYYGLGVEEEEEDLIRRRYEVLDWKAAVPARRSSTPADDDPTLERPLALKHVHRRRFTSNRSWLNDQPEHTAFPGHGTNVITSSDDHSINVYSTVTGQLRRSLSGHTGGVWALHGSTDRTRLEAAHVFDGHTSTPVLDPATGEYQPPYPTLTLRPPVYNDEDDNEAVRPENNPFHIHCLHGHTGAVRALAAYGRTCVTGSYDMTVRVWDIVTGQCKHVLTGHEQKVYSIVYDRYRNRCASGSMDNTVKVWDVVTGECLQTLSGHTSLVGLLGASPNYLVSAAADGCLRVWDQNNGDLKHILASHTGAITCFQHDETKVISGSDGALKLWDIRTGAYIRDLVVGITSVWQVSYHDNILVAASNRGGSTVFDIFDFGSECHTHPVDDDRLDSLRRPPWEPANPMEPRAYQIDDIDGVELTSPRDLGGVNPITSPRGINALMAYARTVSKGRMNRLAQRQISRCFPLPLGGPGDLHVSPIDLRGTSARHELHRTVSPSPAGPSNYHMLASGSGSRSATMMTRESFAPIFDDDRGDEVMEEDVKDEPM